MVSKPRLSGVEENIEVTRILRTYRQTGEHLLPAVYSLPTSIPGS